MKLIVIFLLSFSVYAAPFNAGDVVDDVIINQKFQEANELDEIRVIKFYKSGFSTYKIWSNGLVEQSGKHSTGTGNKTITFLVPYESNNMTIETTVSNLNHGASAEIVSHTVNSFVVNHLEYGGKNADRPSWRNAQTFWFSSGIASSDWLLTNGIIID